MTIWTKTNSIKFIILRRFYFNTDKIKIFEIIISWNSFEFFSISNILACSIQGLRTSGSSCQKSSPFLVASRVALVLFFHHMNEVESYMSHAKDNSTYALFHNNIPIWMWTRCPPDSSWPILSPVPFIFQRILKVNLQQVSSPEQSLGFF